MFAGGGGGNMRRWASPEICRLLLSRAAHNLQQPCSAESFSTSSAAAQPTGAKSGLKIRVSLTDSTGRGVFATQRICSGELIHSAKPLVTHPSLALSDRGFYEVDSKADWSLYHDHCRAQGLKYPLMVKRFACMVISGVASADGLEILQPATLLPGAVTQMEEGFELLKWTLSKAQVDKKLTAFLTLQWYLGVLARIRVNAFRIELVATSHEDLLASAVASVSAESAVGNAVYMLPSLYNHDCDPNTHILWIDNANAKLKALRHIKEGEELRICYLDASMDRDARQKLLTEGFGFHCCCFRCLSGD